MRVRYNAYDLDPATLARVRLQTVVVAQANALPDGILLWPVQLGHSLVDHRNRLARRSIIHTQRPATQQRDAEHVEVLRTGYGKVRVGHVFLSFLPGEKEVLRRDINSGL